MIKKIIRTVVGLLLSNTLVQASPFILKEDPDTEITRAYVREGKFYLECCSGSRVYLYKYAPFSNDIEISTLESMKTVEMRGYTGQINELRYYEVLPYAFLRDPVKNSYLSVLSAALVFSQQGDSFKFLENFYEEQKIFEPYGFTESLLEKFRSLDELNPILYELNFPGASDNLPFTVKSYSRGKEDSEESFDPEGHYMALIPMQLISSRLTPRSDISFSSGKLKKKS